MSVTFDLPEGDKEPRPVPHFSHIPDWVMREQSRPPQGWGDKTASQAPLEEAKQRDSVGVRVRVRVFAGVRESASERARYGAQKEALKDLFL